MTPLIPVHYILQIADYLQDKGHSSKQWLARFQLTPDDIINEGTLLDFVRYQKLIMAAIQLSGEQEIGFNIGQRLLINSHGALGFALLNCGTLRQAIELFQRYIATRTPLIAIECQQKSTVLKISIIELYDIDSFRPAFLDTVLVTFTQVLAYRYGQGNIFNRVELSFARPEYWQQYSSLFNCEVSFNQAQTALYISHSILDKVLVGEDKYSLKLAESFCEIELARLKSSGQFTNKIRRLLMISENDQHTLSAVAKRLNLTSRTLHRHLILEETSFKQILAEVKLTLAKQYLSKGWQVTQVAYQLGYSDIANFRRAFKRWQGQSPSEFRQRINERDIVGAKK
jgi:AraC-like DNA-binding protein